MALDDVHIIDEGLMFLYQAAGVLRYAFDKAK